MARTTVVRTPAWGTRARVPTTATRITLNLMILLTLITMVAIFCLAGGPSLVNRSIYARNLHGNFKDIRTITYSAFTVDLDDARTKRGLHNDTVETIRTAFDELKRKSEEAKMNAVVELNHLGAMNDSKGVALALDKFSVESTRLYAESIGLLRRLCKVAEQEMEAGRPMLNFGVMKPSLAYTVLDALHHQSHDAEAREKQATEVLDLEKNVESSEGKEVKLEMVKQPEMLEVKEGGERLEKEGGERLEKEGGERLETEGSGRLEKEDGVELDADYVALHPAVAENTETNEIQTRSKRSMDYFNYFTTGGGESDEADERMIPSRDMNQVPFYLRFKMPPPPDYHEYNPGDERPMLSENMRCLIGGISFVVVAAFGAAMYFCKPDEEEKSSKRSSVKKSAQTETAQDDEPSVPEPEDIESLIE